MTEIPYSNREIDQFNSDLRQDILGLHAKIDKVLEQTTRTNGRLRTLEGWKMFVNGIMAVLITLIVPVFVGVIIYYLTRI
jgi:hypothetical protein